MSDPTITHRFAWKDKNDTMHICCNNPFTTTAICGASDCDDQEGDFKANYLCVPCRFAWDQMYALKGAKTIDYSIEYQPS